MKSQSGGFREGNDQISIANEFVAFRRGDTLWLRAEYRGYSPSAFYKGPLAFGYDGG